MLRSRSFIRFTMRVSLPHLGHAVDFVVSMTFLRSAVFAIFGIPLLLTGMCRQPAGCGSTWLFGSIFVGWSSSVIAPDGSTRAESGTPYSPIESYTKFLVPSSPAKLRRLRRIQLRAGRLSPLLKTDN